MTRLMIEVSTVIVGVIVAVITVVGLLDLRNCSGSTSDFGTDTTNSTRTCNSHPGNGGLAPS